MADAATRKPGAAEADAKLTHAAVSYEHPAKNPATTCQRCLYYIPGRKGGCELVVDPIHADGWCKKFETNPATDTMVFQGLNLFIENRPGSVRSGTDFQGKPWTVRLSYPYGYIQGTRGVDGDGVDCFVGPLSDASHAYVVHTLNPKTEKEDEDKVMLGFGSAREAQQAFMDNYSDPTFFGSMDKIPMAVLVEKLKQRGSRLEP